MPIQEDRRRDAMHLQGRQGGARRDGGTLLSL
jgi:hypothetical protein